MESSNRLSILLSNEIWQEILIPFLEDEIEQVLADLCSAHSADERAVCQGRLIALKSILHAPSKDMNIVQLDRELNEEEGTQNIGSRRIKFRRSGR
jgi:hypothetical protein